MKNYIFDAPFLLPAGSHRELIESNIHDEYTITLHNSQGGWFR
jgi:hypothetical protein